MKGFNRKENIKFQVNNRKNMNPEFDREKFLNDDIFEEYDEDSKFIFKYRIY